MGNIAFALVNGLAMGMLLFIAASGLTLIFGVLGILNFAQGGFLALGAFALYTFTRGSAVSATEYVLWALVASVSLGIVGLILEVLIFRRLQRADSITALLATFAILLMIQGAIQQIWGVHSFSVQLPRSWRGMIDLGFARVPIYSVVLIVVGAVVAAALILILRRTSAGRVIRAVARDREMSAALGINSKVIYTITFVVGAALGGLGGAFLAPLVGLDSSLAGTLVVESFAVVIVGGLGSIGGALVAALFFGVLNNVVSMYDLTLAGFTLYIGMVLVLVIRPSGLARVKVGRY